MGEMTIGKAALAAGVKIDTIRYYQRRGLLQEPSLPLGGQRKYSAAAVLRVRFIKRSQTLGFTLEEARSLLSFELARNCCDTRQLALKKIQEIDGRIADLRRMRKTLSGLANRCEADNEPTSCPIIETLARA